MEYALCAANRKSALSCPLLNLTLLASQAYLDTYPSKNLLPGLRLKSFDATPNKAGSALRL